MATNSKLYFDDENFRELNSFLAKNKERYSQVVILTDTNVNETWIPQIIKSCEALSEVEIIELEPGEEQKNIDVVSQIWATLLDLNADKNTLILNVGGGVITDIGGFIAACYKRGIAYVNMPTTLLAAVDAAIGGKTGIDFNGIKNQIGSFYHSNGVIINPSFFDTLPEREFMSGFAEAIKHVLIARADLWPELKKSSNPKDFVAKYLKDLVEVKTNIVAIDPLEKNERQYLNYGHTLGHALESYCIDHNIEVTHGLAVAWGCVLENDIATHKGMLSKEDNLEIREYLTKVYQFPEVNASAIPDLLEICKHDKKNENGEIRFAFLRSPGSISSKQPASIDEITLVLRDHLA